MAVTDEQWVIVCMGFPVENMPCDDVNKYLSYYDPDGKPNGTIRWSADVTQALVFHNVEAALNTLSMQSKRVPLRPDGQPNRPLRAYNVELAQLTKGE